MLKPQVIHEDNHLLVLNKPVAMPCVPDKSKDLSLFEWAKSYIKITRNKPGNAFVAIVHRLDRPVSGVVCFALTSKAASRLSDQLRRHLFSKYYIAICKGKLKEKKGEIKSWLIKDKKRNQVIIYDQNNSPPNSKFACTRWELLEERGELSLVKLIPVTGRPHQLRAQMASIGAPILGDLKYGYGPKMYDGGIFLHAYKLSFIHPTKRKEIDFFARVPNKFQEYFREISTYLKNEEFC